VHNDVVGVDVRCFTDPVLETTSICVIDDAGAIIWRGKCRSDPDPIPENNRLTGKALYKSAANLTSGARPIGDAAFVGAEAVGPIWPSFGPDLSGDADPCARRALIRYRRGLFQRPAVLEIGGDLGSCDCRGWSRCWELRTE
jgi:hypothetical protein